MLGHRELTGDEYIEILRRRWWIVLIPALLTPLITYGISLRIPNRYVSQTLVLIEQQRVPDTLVRGVITEELQQRLASMKEQILSRTRLQPIIERYGLYKGDSSPMEDKVDQMRKQIVVLPITPIQTVGGQGMPGFTISFTSENPRTAQQICSDITSLFMAENLRQRGEAAAGTTAFIADQVKDAKQQLDDQDAKLAEFKKKYLGQMPGDDQQNLTMLATTNSQLDAVTQQLNRALQDKNYGQSLLAQQVQVWKASQGPTSTLTMPATSTLQTQLATAQAQLVALQARYTPDHPDVVKLTSQIAALKKMIGDADAATQQAQKRNAATAATASDGDNSADSINEPIEIRQLRLQVRQLDGVIKEKVADQARLQREVQKYQGRLSLTPVVEEQYKELTRDYSSAQAFYTDLLSKQKQSEMGADLEKRQQGEQFQVMDPANLPEKPAFPNRPMLAAGGLAGGLVLGLGIAWLVEMRDKSIRTERDVQFWLELPTLSSLPVAGGRHEKRRWAVFRRKPQMGSAA